MEAGIAAKLAAGTGATAAVAAPAGLGYAYRDEISSYFNKKEPENNELKTLNDKLISLGLPNGCKFSSVAIPVDCSIKNTEINSVKFKNKGSDSISTDTSVDLRIEKISETNIHPNGLKFTFTSNKEIKTTPAQTGGLEKTVLVSNVPNVFKMNSEGNQLEKVATIQTPPTQENTELKALNDKLTPLNLPTECKFKTVTDSVSCSIKNTEINSVVFREKTTGNNITTSEDVELKIEKINTADSNFPDDLKFIFKAKKDVKIGASAETGKIFLKEGINYEFNKNSNENKLERTWTVGKLGEKVGLQNCSDKKECELKEAVNLWLKEKNGVTGAKPKDVDKSKKVKFTEDNKDYNQGFKFTVDGEISLENGTKIDGTTEEMKLKTDSEYEINLKGGT